MLAFPVCAWGAYDGEVTSQAASFYYQRWNIARKKKVLGDTGHKVMGTAAVVHGWNS